MIDTKPGSICDCDECDCNPCNENCTCDSCDCGKETV